MQPKTKRRSILSLALGTLTTLSFAFPISANAEDLQVVGRSQLSFGVWMPAPKTQNLATSLIYT